MTYTNSSWDRTNVLPLVFVSVTDSHATIAADFLQYYLLSVIQHKADDISQLLSLSVLFHHFPLSPSDLNITSLRLHPAI